MTTAPVRAGDPIVCTDVRVVHREEIGESFVRLVVAGPGLGEWSADVTDPGPKADTYVKVLIPPPGGAGPAPTPDDVRGWFALPEPERGWMRTYTVRRAGRVVTGGLGVPALTLDVVIHPGESEGPGSRWARTARIGDPLRMLGPGRTHPRWAAWSPGSAGRIVCAGDETAAPAILAIAEEVAGSAARTGADGGPGVADLVALLEVPTGADVRALRHDAPEGVLIRRRAGAPGTALLHALADEFDLGAGSVDSVLAGERPAAEPLWQPATGSGPRRLSVFLAGEATVVRAMRRLVVDAAGVDKAAVAFMGYWRRGASES